MEYYEEKLTNTFWLIKTLFWIILTTILVATIIFFTVNVRDTVDVISGEIFSDSAPKQYLASEEAEVLKIFVNEGDVVNLGDTIMILQNENLSSEISNLGKEIDMKRSNIRLLNDKIYNLDRKLSIHFREFDHLDNDLNVQKNSLTYELGSLEEQLELMNGQLIKSEARVEKDRLLFEKGAISDTEFRRKEKIFQEEKNNYLSMKNDLFRSRNTLNNYHRTKQSSLEKQNLEIISTRSQLLDLKSTLTRENSELLRLEQQRKTNINSLNKLFIIAEMDGYASAIFNLKRDLNYVSKGQALVTINPLKQSNFYANLVVNEKEMKDIQVGHKAKIKVDAYNHYQFGVLEGEVIQINKDELNAFYVTADIKDNKKFNLKSGYKVTGEVDLNEIKLSQYVFNLLFEKL